MQTRSRDIFATIRTEGALLPADLLQRIAEGDGDLKGLKLNDYHLVEGEKLNEAISRSWNRLLAVWNSFIAAVDKLPEKDLGTTLTREKWLLPLFQELGYGRLPTSKAVVIEGKSYPISHFWQPAPIHLIGCRVDIDRRTAGVAGAARISPHGLVQEFLNRSEPHLWAFVSNGLRLRILRDNVSLTRQAFVEFDLAGMMDGEVYSDFILLWLLCHQSRVEVPEDKSPEHCWLEKWSQTAQQQGTRALDQLRKGVEEAIKSLGSGFLSHLANTELKEKLKNGALDKQEYYRQLLRTVYRFIFIFASEDRGLLLEPQADQQAKDCYMQYYSAVRLRKLAQKKRGTRHCDLWRGLSLVFGKLGSNEGCPELALPALGSYLWSREAIADLDGCDIANRDLLEAVRALAFTVDNNILRAVDYKNLGSEELGSVYESLLELHPELNVDVGAFELSQAAGSERKTTGSYYTPTSLVNCLLDSALEPVLDEAVKKPDPEQAILNLKVCDPATGSGHFLVAAAHRMAKRLAAIRTGDDEPSPEATRMAIRDVIGHCIYGVDINPMAVELCKVSLWLEALEPGKPLSFLDHHIKCGNSLLGTTPALMERGIPDDAFKPIEGDDKKACAVLRKRNKAECKGLGPLFAKQDAETQARLEEAAAALEELPDDRPEDIRMKEQAFRRHEQTLEYRHKNQLADAWCTAFVMKKHFREPGRESSVSGITQGHLNDLAGGKALPGDLATEVEQLSGKYQFFHWHLAFPEVFAKGGFDCVLGNPPWERIKLQEKEFFASLSPEIANAPNAAKRRALIAKLPETNPDLYQIFCDAKRLAEGMSHIVRDSRCFPFCGRGDINTYSIFSELKRNLINPTGWVGCIVPSGIATDDTTKFFFQDLISSESLASLYSFENEEFIFPQVHHATKFCLLTMSGLEDKQEFADFLFFARQPHYLKDQHRHFNLSSNDIALINPNTRTCPIFRSKNDAEITRYIYTHIPVLINEANNLDGNDWGISFNTMFHMANDSYLFHTSEELEGQGYILNGNIFTKNNKRYLPLYEAKMIHLFDHRFGTYEGQTQAQANQGKLPEVSNEQHSEASYCIKPRYWVDIAKVQDFLENKWTHEWVLGWREITSAVTTRSVISAVIPSYAIGNKIPIIWMKEEKLKHSHCLIANLSSFILDYVARQKIGGTSLSQYFFKQFPVIPYKYYENRSEWSDVNLKLSSWIRSIVLELIYTSWELQNYASDCSYDGPPFVWDEERRFKIRAELDAVYFHLYLGTEHKWKEKGSKELLKYFPTPRAAVDYIMETFPIVKHKDEAKYDGKYRTKELILEIYDKMSEAIKTGQPYQTILDPPPADPSVAHPPRDSVKASVTEKINPIYTIGHSNTSVDKLVSLLKQNKIQVLADVRSVPYSRHVPQANREAIERAVKAAGIKYLFMGEQLGGRPKDIIIKDEHGNLDYSKLASTERFREGMDRLLKGASQYHVCLMCSEEDPSRCHRSLLISKELDKLGVEIRHIRRDGHIETQGELEKQIPPAQEGLFSEK